MVSVKAAKEIAKIKSETGTIEFKVLSGDKLMVDGRTFDLFTGNSFPNYKVVIPKYKNFVEFEREKFIQGIKEVVIYANKSTSQVALHINGQIEMSAQDVDFSFEGSRKMPFIKKGIPNTNIAFNGKFLINALSIFKEKNVRMFTDGNANRAGIFSNGKESILIMPLMNNW